MKINPFQSTFIDPQGSVECLVEPSSPNVVHDSEIEHEEEPNYEPEQEEEPNSKPKQEEELNFDPEKGKHNTFLKMMVNQKMKQALLDTT